MKFDKKYKNNGKDYIGDIEVVKHEEELPCFSCGDSTKWRTPGVKAPVCSETCLEKVLEELKDLDTTEKNFDPVQDFLLG